MLDEDFFMVAKIIFITSASLTLIEIVYFYCSKVQGKNIEVDGKTNKPHAKNKFVRGFGFLSVILAAIAIIIGFNSFDEQGCLEKWFIDEENLCKSCTLHFGVECLDCQDSTKCSQC